MRQKIVRKSAAALLWVLLFTLAVFRRARFERSSRIPPLIVAAGVLLVWLIG
jgi:hypothetical protein